MVAKPPAALRYKTSSSQIQGSSLETDYRNSPKDLLKNKESHGRLDDVALNVWPSFPDRNVRKTLSSILIITNPQSWWSSALAKTDEHLHDKPKKQRICSPYTSQAC